MSDDPEAAAIARKLSPSQRRALLWMPARWSTARRQDAGAKDGSLWALEKRGLAEPHYGEGAWWWCISLLGLRVRAVVEKEAADAAE